MALSITDIANILFKSSVGKSSTNNARQFFEEPRDGRQFILPDQIWTEADLIPSTAPGGSDQQITGVVQRWIDLTLTAVAGVSNAFSSDDLIDAIPFNFGDGSYNYEVKDSTDAAIPFGLGDWIVDPNTGTLTFYGTVPANMPPKISFYKYVGTKGVGGSGGDVVGPASATDEAVARFNLATGKLIQNSVVLIDDVGVVSGITQLNVDNLRLDGNSISSTDSNGNIVLDANGTGFVAVESDLRIPEIATPATPASGYGKVYFKSDGNFYQLNDAGVETNLANATGVSNTNFVAYTSPGYGSTATKIFRFTTVEVNNLGGNVTYTSSSVNGDSWTINVEGLYTFTFIFESSDAAREAGITLNQSSLTQNITANPESQQLVSSSCLASRRTSMSVTRWLAAGDVIRACGDGGTVVTGTGDHRFCINKIG